MADIVASIKDIRSDIKEIWRSEVQTSSELTQCRSDNIKSQSALSLLTGAVNNLTNKFILMKLSQSILPSVRFQSTLGPRAPINRNIFDHTNNNIRNIFYFKCPLALLGSAICMGEAPLPRAPNSRPMGYCIRFRNRFRNCHQNY